MNQVVQNFLYLIFFFNLLFRIAYLGCLCRWDKIKDFCFVDFFLQCWLCFLFLCYCRYIFTQNLNDLNQLPICSTVGFSFNGDSRGKMKKIWLCYGNFLFHFAFIGFRTRFVNLLNSWFKFVLFVIFLNFFFVRAVPFSVCFVVSLSLSLFFLFYWGNKCLYSRIILQFIIENRYYVSKVALFRIR